MSRAQWAAAAVADLDDIETHLLRFDFEVARSTVDTLISAARWLAERSRGGPAIGVGAWRRWRSAA